MASERPSERLVVPDHFEFLASNLPAWIDPGIAIAASRAGATGLLNLEHAQDWNAARLAVDRLARYGRGRCGVKAPLAFFERAAASGDGLPAAMAVALITGAPPPAQAAPLVARLRAEGRLVLWECTSVAEAEGGLAAGADALIAKGHEAGGRVGDLTTFVLLQALAARVPAPFYAYGGVGLHAVAACRTAGASGALLDQALALTAESTLPEEVRGTLARLEGGETLCLGGDLGQMYRVYRHPGAAIVAEFQRLEQQLVQQRPEDRPSEWRAALQAHVGWRPSGDALWPLGQDVAFSAPLARRYSNVSGILAAYRASLDAHLAALEQGPSMLPDSPLAAAHGTRYPILQGPMTRVSDRAAFAAAVAEGGALPFLALALLRGPEVRTLLEDTANLLGDRSWGVGMLGFVPHALRQEQLAVVTAIRPRFAVIAGGRPDQAAHLEAAGITTYLHVPTPGLLRGFLRDGARHFIFEGQECGGHVGPRSSFVLWDSAVDVLLEAIDQGVRPDSLHVVFAGGIHDARSAAMAASLAAPLTRRGAKFGVLVGTAYLFTHEAISSGAIVEGFQQEAIECRETVLLESGPGHVTRCAATPFASQFRDTRRSLLAEAKPPDEVRDSLESLNLGRLRIASKGVMRRPGTPAGAKEAAYVEVPPDQQRGDGLYMIGQVATLRTEVCSIADLHEDISVGSGALLARTTADLGTHADGPAVGGTAPSPADIAIVGMGCLLPGAADVATYWANILNRVNAITEVPKERFEVDRYFSSDRRAPDKIYSKWGGFLADVTIDPVRFGIPPSALPSIDPLQLLTLAVVDQALRHAGYADRAFPRDRTSVILGAGGGLGDLGMQYGFRAMLPMFVEHADQAVLERLPQWTEDSFPGILLNVASGRVANRFDFGGVNYSIDAACASSLAAISLGVRELTAGTSDVAIAGGIDTVQSPFGYLCFSKTQALSPRGLCRPFDAAADGIAISEGLAVVVLKRLADAERDGDNIYAVIKAVAGSSDGRDKSLTAPRPEGQQRALTRAYAQAGISPATVGLVEAHGTGTVVGDASEIDSLMHVYRRAGALKESCAIGSVKSMIGHTKSAAGVAGLIKVALALHHRVLPPTLHVDQPNARLREDGSPFYVNTEALPWIRPDGAPPRRAAVSAFGFGGTNFHAVLEEYDGDFTDAMRPMVDAWPAELFCWQEGSGAALRASLDAFTRALGDEPDAPLRDLAARTCRRRASRADRPETVSLAIVASSREDLNAKLAAAQEALGAGKPTFVDPRGIYLRAGASREGKLAMLFPGQGSQVPGMLRDLANHFSEIRESLSRADRVLADRLDKRLSQYVYPPPAFSDEEQQRRQEALTDTRVAQPALGAVELGLHRLLTRLGVSAGMVAGHSYGEYVALAAAGVLSDDALFALSEARGRAIKEAVGDAPGTMAAVEGSAEQIAPLLPRPDTVWIANLNGPRQTVIAGREADVQEAVQALGDAGLRCRAVPVACAFHTPLMAGARARLATAMAEQRFDPPAIPVYSNSLAAPFPTDPLGIRAVLEDHLVTPVQFVREIEAMYAAGARVFLEVGPGGVLAGLARQILTGKPATIVTLGVAGRDGLVQLLHALAQLVVAGIGVDLETLFAGRVQERLAKRSSPADPVTKRPSLTWLVNGGRARPASQAASPTLASASQESRPVPTPNATSSGTANSAPRAAPESSPPPPTATPAPSAEFPQAAAPPPSAGTLAASGVGEADLVMLNFQALMSQFLQTQAAIMTAYFQGSTGPSSNVLVQAPASALLTHVPTAPPGPLAQLPVVPAQQPAVSAAPYEAPPPAAVSAPAPNPVPEASTTSEAPPSVTMRLMTLVSERTGYPVEALEPDLNLEAELGIDSIKRVEILSAYQHSCAPDEQRRVQGLMERLTRSRTLRQMTEVLSEPEAAPGPSQGRGAEERTESPSSGPSTAPRPHGIQVTRSVVTTVDLASVSARRSPAADRLWVITDDERGIAEGIASHVRAQAEQAVLLRHSERNSSGSPSVFYADLREPASIDQAIAAIRARHGPIGAVLHCRPLADASPFPPSTLAEWRDALWLDIKSLYAIARATSDDLQRRGRAGGATFAAATALGGVFGTAPWPPPAPAPAHGGVAAMVKTLFREWPDVRCLAVDLDPSEPAAALERHLVEELEAADEWPQVGRLGARRTTPLCTTATLTDGNQQSPLGPEAVVLLTGGARGVTAEVARHLAERHRPRLVLVGRTPLPAHEAPDTDGVTDLRQLKAALGARLASNGRTARPAQIEEAYRTLMREREIRRTVEMLRHTGAVVEYVDVDVRDEHAFGAVIDDIYARLGRLDVVVHGAGVIEDKLIADKTPDSFDRVLLTKLESAFVLVRRLRPEGLRALVLMASVTATYGNRGQADYAAANGVLNGLASLFSAQWPGRVVAMNWGPWDKVGMVTPEVRRQFLDKGIQMVPPGPGAEAVRVEIEQGDQSHPVVVVGDGPWVDEALRAGTLESAV